MKAYIIVFLIAFAISCWVNDTGGPPYPYAINLAEPTEFTFNVKHEAGLIPELSFTDQARPVGIMTKVDEKSDTQMIDFPHWARE
jgi:hypothetical protein